MEDSPATLEIRTEFDISDWDAYIKATARRIHSSARFNPSFLIPAIVAGLVVIALFFADRLGWGLSPAGLVLGVIVFPLAAAIASRLARQSYRPRANGYVLGPNVLRFSAQGIQNERMSSSGTCDWRLYEGTSQTPTHIFVWVDSMSGYVVPKRHLPAGLSAEQFCAAIDTFARQGRGDAAATEQPKSAPRASATLLVVTLVAAVLLWAAVDYLLTGAQATFASFNMSGVSWYVLGALLLAWLVSARADPSPPYVAVALRVVLFGLPALIALTLLLRIDNEPLWRGVTYAVVFVGSLGILWYLKRATGSWQFRPSALAGVAALVFWWATTSFYISASLWYVPESQSADEGNEWQQSEALLFAQAEKVDAAVAAIAPGSDTKPEAFFVGFAGYGAQRVFAEEIALAERVIGERFGTATRSVRLVNDRRDRERYPLATVTGLERALSGIAQRMDPEHDVLFLALSSHGSEGAELSVSNGSMPLIQLTGSDLARMLREAGVRRKVILISACYAGSFVDDLKDDDTIVITAAAADRTSFGCSDDRELTYFGEAFYRDAFPKANSLRQAFDTARAAIAAREKAEEQTPSNPQAQFGARLEAYLANWPASVL